MNAMTRKATELDKRMALGRLFSALPVRQGDATDQIELYVFALEDVTHHALDTVVAQAIRGQHPKLSRKFAPTCAELGEAVIDEMDRIKRQIELAQEKLRIEDNRHVAMPTLRLHDRVDAAKSKMAAEGRKFLFECESFSAGASSKRNVPVGSTYVGILGAWYGPEGSLHQPEPQPVAEVDPPAEPVPEPEFLDVEF